MKRRSLYQTLVRQFPQQARDKVAIRLGTLLRRPLPAVVHGVRVQLDLREYIQRSMFLGSYEPDQTTWMRECVCQGDIVLDVGANRGYYTYLAACLVGPNGKVFAFEPSPLACHTMSQALTRNALDNVNLTVAAVGDAAGSATLFVGNTENVHSPSLVPLIPESAQIVVPVIRLDDFAPLTDGQAIRLVKIDVEGYEPNVLAGMETMLRSGRVENIFCEFNSNWLERNGTTIPELQGRFLALGYQPHKQTVYHRDVEGDYGVRYDMVDIWYRR